MSELNSLNEDCNDLFHSFSIMTKSEPPSSNNNLIDLTNETSYENGDIFGFIREINPNPDEIIEPIITNKIFETKKKKTRGKQSHLKRKTQHSSISFDNIQTKIQVHFFSFIINVSNDALLAFFHDKNIGSFKEIDYKIKIISSHANFEALKNGSIKNVLENNISKKYTKFGRDYNNQLLNKIYDPTNWLGKFFDMNYIQLFDYYYNNQKELNKIVFEGKEIILNKKKTKSFYDLLKKNYGIKYELNNAVKSVYYFDFNNHFFCS